MESAPEFPDYNNVLRVCSHFRVVYLHSGCQINNHSNADSTVCVDDFIVKMLQAYIYNGDKYLPNQKYLTVKTFL